MTIPIKRINLRKLNMALKYPFTTSFGTLQTKHFYIIEISDNEGNKGYGESVAFISPWYTEETVETNIHMMRDFLIPILKENTINHPDDVSDLFKPIKRNNMAKAALETAIWDLYAKRQNQSLAKALGGKKERIDVGISIGIKETTEELINDINQYLEQGYKRIKMKIKPGKDINVLKEVREAFPHTPIMVDANSAYTLDDLDHLKQLDQYNLMMIEQPLASDDIIDHATLQAQIETPICLDESIHSLEDTRKAVQLGSCEVINIKIGRVGGLTEAKKIHDYCLEHNIDVWCGGMLEAGVGRAHNIALTSLTGFTMPGDTAGSQSYWYKDIITPEVVVEDGMITVPHEAGIGYEINEKVLEEFTVEEEVFEF